MENENLIKSFVRYYRYGQNDDCWAVDEMINISSTDPEKAWELSKRILQVKVEGKEWRSFLDNAVALGPVENIIVLNSERFLGEILGEARTNPRLRMALASIYESSVGEEIWQKIQVVINDT
ncbi:hypothetical protein A3197_20790 [Candidatus Thiodiazotropha endoloripes]|nr:hypothetical protein A3197_20790 [Candidatus Thiodiazotropha endoloripes]